MLTFCTIWALMALAQPAPLGEIPSTSEFLCLEKACYSISWEKKQFAKAKTMCEAKNGQLQTVKNSVQAEAISLLVSKAKEDVRVWIGLEQPYENRCTDMFQPLRGFTWVSGDSDTDYHKWGNPEVKKCGALCVTVRKDGTWEETNCKIKADGYLCELNYQDLCSPLNRMTDFNITYAHKSLGLGRSGGHDFPPGTNAYIPTFQDSLLCANEGDGPAQWKSLTPGPWDCSIKNGGCENDCVVEDGTPKCTCPSDTQLKEDNRTCAKPCDPNPCSQLCFEISESPGFVCMCQEGYELVDDGKTCIDIDDCAVNPNICDHHCTNTIGSFVCDCKPGFDLVTNLDCDNPHGCPSECVDVNECNSPFTLCEHDCANLEGSYRCFCFEGFVVDEKNPTKCKRFCNTSFCEAECDINLINQCECPEGYIVDENDEGKVICTDIDECEDNPCNGICTNSFGSFECTCLEGFTFQGSECISTEEGSGVPDTTTGKRPFETPPTKVPPPDIHSLQPAMLLGICIGVISMLTVLIAILCHMLRKHYMEQHALDYKTKNAESDVRLQQVKMDPQRKL
ncbi:thrombomodulin-like [Mantella aurantiaca]